MYASLISELLLSWARPFFTHALYNIYNTDVNIDFHFAISDEHVFFVCILQTEVLTSNMLSITLRSSTLKIIIMLYRTHKPQNVGLIHQKAALHNKSYNFAITDEICIFSMHILQTQEHVLSKYNKSC